jgi:hypothetical protein
LEKLELIIDNIDNEYLSESTKTLVLKETKESIRNINNIEIDLFDEHFMNLFHFLDYLSQTEHNMEMTFAFEDDDTSMDITGEFAEELWLFCNTVTNLNVLSWYNRDLDKNIKGLTFKSLADDLEIMKEYYLADMEEISIDELYEKYRSVKDSLYQ